MTEETEENKSQFFLTIRVSVSPIIIFDLKLFWRRVDIMMRLFLRYSSGIEDEIIDSYSLMYNILKHDPIAVVFRYYPNHRTEPEVYSIEKIFLLVKA